MSERSVDVPRHALAVVPMCAARPGLSGREQDVLARVAIGASNSAIAADLCLSERTVEAHVRSIFTKLGLFESEWTNRRVLAVLAMRRPRRLDEATVHAGEPVACS
jgi:DNA-binding NarL/FixJ family response regulator